MPIAALPDYLGQDFKDASPGMRFGLLLPIWTERQDQEAEVRRRAEARSHEGQEIADILRRQGMDATIAVLRQRERNRLPGLWEKNDFAARNAWSNIKALTKHDRDRIKALADRHIVLAGAAHPEALLRLEALATAPFTTGLGNEHPLENGFAFLNPYGLPYLPGSGVKGVLRQAAWELASGDWGETHGWNDAAIEILFGRESKDGDTEHLRGALIFWDVVPIFWDVVPQIAGDSLAVEIMTPHQGHYYQQKPHAGSASPHESGQPNPISFLTVPPKSRFVFHVQCDLAHLDRLAAELAQDGRWKTLLEAAFHHAYQWLGFGAKTAVGYGAMQEDPKAHAERERQQAAAQAEADRQAEQARRASLSPDDLAWEEHKHALDAFRQQFETASKTAHKPGSLFDSQRNDFMKLALTWEDRRSRQAAGELLNATMTKAWGTPANKDSKQRLKDAVNALAPDTP